MKTPIKICCSAARLIAVLTLTTCGTHKNNPEAKECTFENAKAIALTKFKRKYGEKIELLEAKDTLGRFYIVMSTKVRPPHRDGDTYTMYNSVSTEYWFKKDNCTIEKTLSSQ